MSGVLCKHCLEPSPWLPITALPQAELLGEDCRGRCSVEPGLPLTPSASPQGPQLWALGEGTVP